MHLCKQEGSDALVLAAHVGWTRKAKVLWKYIYTGTYRATVSLSLAARRDSVFYEERPTGAVQSAVVSLQSVVLSFGVPE